MMPNRSTPENRPVVLLVEDDDDDVLLIVKALRRAVPEVDVVRVEDGSEALDLLQNESHSETFRPTLLLIDLNMPLMNGLELLQEIKTDSSLSDIPVVVLTTSDDQNDIAKCYANRVNSYVVKPIDLSEFQKRVGDIGRFWLQAATPPPAKHCSTAT